jgi:hypothetical protein
MAIQFMPFFACYFLYATWLVGNKNAQNAVGPLPVSGGGLAGCQEENSATVPRYWFESHK